MLEAVDQSLASIPLDDAVRSSNGFPARVLWDLRAAQNPTNGERGIARYVFEHARAFQEEFPGIVEAFATNGTLPVPGRLWPLVADGRLRHLDELVTSVDSSEPWIWYQSSPVEMDYFKPDAKCCTYHPGIPNYLVGAILADQGEELAEGRRRLRARIEARIGVTPGYIQAPRKYNQIYSAARGTGDAVRAPAPARDPRRHA